MSEHFDFRKEWEKTKSQLLKFSKDAAVIAKKGEKELLALSQKSKLQMDSTAIQLKREKLYYLIGKECAKQRSLAQPSKTLLSFLDELKDIEKEQKKIKTQMSKSNTKTKSASSRSTKKKAKAGKKS